MAQTQAPPHVGSGMVRLTFESPSEIRLATLLSELAEVNEAFTEIWKLFLEQKRGQTSEDEIVKSLFGKTPSDLRMYDPTGLYVVHISYNSPLEMILAAANAPRRVVKAFIHFLKSIAFYEETRNKMRADGALAWEKVQSERLKNVQTVAKIARSLKDSDPIEFELVSKLLGLHGSIQAGALRLRSVQTEDDETSAN